MDFDPFGLFCVSKFVAFDRLVSGCNRLVCFEDFSDLSLDKTSIRHRDSQFRLCGPSWESAFKHCDFN